MPSSPEPDQEPQQRSRSRSRSRPRQQSPLRPIMAFAAVLLLLYVIFNWSKPPVQATDVSSGAAKRAMEAIKKQQTGQKFGQQAGQEAPKQ